MRPSRMLLGLAVATALVVPLASAGRDFYRILGVDRNANEKCVADLARVRAGRTRLRDCSGIACAFD